MSTERYQAGSLEKRQTRMGLCWFLRFRKRDGGDVKRVRIRIGLVSELPTKSAARRAADHLRSGFNNDPVQPTRYFRDVIARYEQEEMSAQYSTAKSEKSRIHKHILPKWGDVPLEAVKPEAVRLWLRNLNLAPKTQGHIRGTMRVLFRFAMLWDWVPITLNPMSTFAVSTKRRHRPRSISLAEFKTLLKHIDQEPFRTMVQTAACLGLRCSELLGLRWDDFDWSENLVQLRRGVVDGQVGELKTEASAKPLPLNPMLVEVLLSHLRNTLADIAASRRNADGKNCDEFKESDWVFASPYSGREKPYHGSDIRKRIIRPAAIASKLQPEDATPSETIGWHTFRHSYRSWLAESGAQMDVQKDLMRHSDISTTMNTYGDTFPEALRDANSKVVSRILQ